MPDRVPKLAIGRFAPGLPLAHYHADTSVNRATRLVRDRFDRYSGSAHAGTAQEGRGQAGYRPMYRQYRATCPGLGRFSRCTAYSPVGEGSTDSEAEAEADADGASEAEAEAEAEAEGSTELEAGTDGSGTGVGSGMNREGMPRTESIMMSTKKPITRNIHGRASRSCRVGSEPR